MPISIRCTGCEKNLKVKDEVAGKRIKCPSCGLTIPIPAESPSPPTKATTPMAGKSPPNVKRAASPATRPLASPKKAVRWTLYAGGVVVVLCLGVGLAFGFGFFGNTSQPVGNKVAFAPQPKVEDLLDLKPKDLLEPKGIAKPEVKVEVFDEDLKPDPRDYLDIHFVTKEATKGLVEFSALKDIFVDDMKKSGFSDKYVAQFERQLKLAMRDGGKYVGVHVPRCRSMYELLLIKHLTTRLPGPDTDHFGIRAKDKEKEFELLMNKATGAAEEGRFNVDIHKENAFCNRVRELKELILALPSLPDLKAQSAPNEPKPAPKKQIASEPKEPWQTDHAAFAKMLFDAEYKNKTNNPKLKDELQQMAGKKVLWRGLVWPNPVNGVEKTNMILLPISKNKNGYIVIVDGNTKGSMSFKELMKSTAAGTDVDVHFSFPESTGIFHSIAAGGSPLILLVNFNDLEITPVK